MPKVRHLTRRQFGVGGVCAAAAVSLLPTGIAAASAELSPQILATLDPELQDKARQLARYWQQFCLADERYDADDSILRKHWANSYNSVVWQAENIRDRFVPESEAERALIAWSNSIFPPERKRVREGWGDIPGLSPKFVRLNNLFNKVMMIKSKRRYAWLALQGGVMRNPLTDAENKAFDLMRVCESRGSRTARRIIAASAVTTPDRTIKRRAIEYLRGPPRLYDLKFRLMAQGKLHA